MDAAQTGRAGATADHELGDRIVEAIALTEENFGDGLAGHQEAMEFLLTELGLPV